MQPSTFPLSRVDTKVPPPRGEVPVRTGFATRDILNGNPLNPLFDVHLSPATQAAAASEDISLLVRVINIIVMIFPPAGLIIGIVLLWGPHFSWMHLCVFVGMYLITGFGITVGYHRLFTHKSFETSRWMKLMLAIFGSMAVQGPLLKWCAVHRAAPSNTATPTTIRTRRTSTATIRPACCAGWWHAHVGWIFAPEPMDLGRYVGDLAADRSLRVVSSMFSCGSLLGLFDSCRCWADCSRCGGSGALLGFIWGGLIRIFLVHHVTWSINSVCHIWGRQPFRSRDQSRNNPSLACWASARAGTTTTTRSRRRRGTACAGGKWTPRGM